MMQERRQAIVDMINQMGEVTLKQLKESFPSVSEVTLRTDLKYLDKKNQIVRIHGGAKALGTIAAGTNLVLARSAMHHKEKMEIAAKAVSLIQPYDSIFISSGSTCVELAKQLPQMPLYIFTDGIGTLLNIPYYPEYSVELLGGTFDYNAMRVIGPSVTQAVENLHFATVFLGTSGLHPSCGFNSHSAIVIDTQKAIIARSEKTVMLMDSSKLNYSVSPRSIPFDLVDILITDSHFNPSVAASLKENGINVL